MNPAPETLEAFVEAAALGSFSAAARKLGRSQSTISTAIANLEIDLGLSLFDRSSRKPSLTAAGETLLPRVEAILGGYGQLVRAAAELLQGAEPRVTVALSDTYQSDRFETSLRTFQDRFANTELECLVAECGDLVALVQSGRAQIGFVEQQRDYPADVAFETVADATEIALYVAHDHPLAAHAGWIPQATLLQHRELRLSTVLQPRQTRSRGSAWSAPSYLMLMEMAQLGLGWAPIPRWLVTRFAGNSLEPLQVRGWPKTVHVDAVWSTRRKPGPASTWLLRDMLR